MNTKYTGGHLETEFWNKYIQNRPQKRKNLVIYYIEFWICSRTI